MAVQVIVAHHAADYDRWLPAFKEHGEVRRRHGSTGATIYRGVEDPNQIVVVNEMATLEGARGFMEDPSLKDAMDRAGVDGQPTIYVVERSGEEPA